MNGNSIIWTPAMIGFLKKNFFEMTNPQLASELGLKLIVTRNKCRELGLKRIEMEYWTKEQVDFLRENYKVKGDVEIAGIFEYRWPKKKKWIKQHICKKRRYLKFKRTTAEIHDIASKNSKPGGKSFTIDKNSSSKNMHPTWLAQQICWRDPEMQKEILAKRPDLIEMKKQMILLQRAIKHAGKNSMG